MNPPDELLKLSKFVRQRVRRWVQNKAGITQSMCGACAIASYALYKVLLHKGKSPGLVIAQMHNDACHCWVECDGWAIDLTASQFNRQPVVIVPSSDYDVIDYSKTNTLYYRGSAAHQHLKDWTYNQNPFTYNEHIKRMILRL